MNEKLTKTVTGSGRSAYYAEEVNELIIAFEQELKSSRYQIARAIAQLEAPLTVEGDLNYMQVRLAAESVVFQLRAYEATVE
ncbi:hypothetical protein LCGC14_2390780 [marine sediment metagenome]|uniref:Uncharacterized protein n=1 Tax=marine sediment metagenome TaxID=412755 RepID=A0A0F9ESS1_9ZZZZ